MIFWHTLSSDEASVSFRFTEDESGKPSLSLKSADCDHHEPLHFMAEYFLAYSSTDKDCNIRKFQSVS